jgi:hypothetical protein
MEWLWYIAFGLQGVEEGVERSLCDIHEMRGSRREKKKDWRDTGCVENSLW